MPRKPNDISTTQITISTTEKVESYLLELVSTGLYGKNVAEAAERLLTKGIEAFLRDGVLRGQSRARTKRSGRIL